MSDHLILFPDPRLRKVSTAVTTVTPQMLERVRDMFPIMYEEKGIGLAAPQIGWNIRLFIMNVSGEPEDELVLVNPEIVSNEGSALMEEGCLSLPDIRGKFARPARIKVRAKTVLGSALLAATDLSQVTLQDSELEADGLVCRCIQHELDHLDGVLIIDKFSPAKKQSIKARLRELEDRYSELAR